MNDQKQHFKVTLEDYMYQCAFDEAIRETYIKKLLRDRQYIQKLLSMKSDDVAIEIEVLNEMLEKVK